MNAPSTISGAFPFQSHYVDVLDSRMHYIDEGKANDEVILFVHGIPTSSYLWRNIIPEVSSSARCIALDLIGMGKSGKPDITYDLADYIRYFDAFIQALGLKKLVLVTHGLGSVLGLDYARRHPSQIKGLVFMEAYVRPVDDWHALSLPVQEFAVLMKKTGEDAVIHTDFYFEKIFSSGMLRPLTEQELSYYQAPFQTPESRRLLWQYFQQLPLGKEDSYANQLIQKYTAWLQKTDVPKLMFYGVPGFVTTIDTVVWAKEHLSELTLVEIDEALHYPQEQEPHKIGIELRTWFEESVAVGV